MALPLQSPAPPLHGQCTLVGHMGHTKILYLVGDPELVHEFWLTNIWDLCVIGLLTHWGVHVDVSGAPITPGMETVVLLFVREEQDPRASKATDKPLSLRQC